MKVYIICFDGETIAYPKAFLDRELAEKQLYAMQYAMDKVEGKSYSHWYSVEEMEVVFGEAHPTTLEEVYEL